MKVCEYVDIALTSLEDGYFYSEIDIDRLEEIVYDFFLEEYNKKVEELKVIVRDEDSDREKPDNYYINKVKELDDFMLELIDKVTMYEKP